MNGPLEDIQHELTALTQQFLIEQSQLRAAQAVTLDISLERQLGIDSLGKVELFRRVERRFGVQLSDTVLSETDTLNELAKAILLAKPTLTLPHSVVKPLNQLEVDLSQCKTLQDTLDRYVKADPTRPHVYFQDEMGQTTILTYGELFNGACIIANSLIQLGIKPGDTISLMLPTGFDFFESFFGILLAGALPVPIYPPFRMDRLEEYALREAKILNNAEARMLITFGQASLLSRGLKSYVPSLYHVVTVPELQQQKHLARPALIYHPDQSALLQYTSGSTGDPKGILLQQKNIIHNLSGTGKALAVSPMDVLVSWLPLYHDMGLMSWLGSLFFGIPLVIMSPLTFLNHPARWLWAIHTHRGTFSAGPNFAYELCVKRVEKHEIEGLDLSAWRLACNGAEAVSVNTLQRFYEKYKDYGFKQTAIFPVYGLAENTVALAVPPLNRPMRVDRIDREAFEQHQKAVSTSSKAAFEFAAEGFAIPGSELRICDEHNLPLPERHIGHVQFRGNSAMQGYYHNPAATLKIFHEGWWETGDLGYLADGELFITGRQKDLIIKAGRNIYPESIEQIAGDIRGIRKGCVIAFGVADPKIGTEKIIVVAESSEYRSPLKQELITQITEKVAVGIGVPPDQIILIAPRTIPKTSSGKLQRSNCKTDYLAGKLEKKPITLPLQIIIFGSRALKQWVQYSIRWAGKFFFTLYGAFLVIITIFPAWIGLKVLPRRLAHALIKIWVKIIFCLLGCPIHIRQKSYLYRAHPMVFVSNHASYIDALVLLSALPVNTIFVGKKELLQMPVVKRVMKKLKFLTVDRWDFTKNIEDTQRIELTLKQGESILMFPEGTFTYATGLRPFKIGAFQLAVNAQCSVCPIALRGTRKFLREGAILATRSSIEIIVHSPLIPRESSWDEAVHLRNQTRQIIAQDCGEPVVDMIVAGPPHE